MDPCSIESLRELLEERETHEILQHGTDVESEEDHIMCRTWKWLGGGLDESNFKFSSKVAFRRRIRCGGQSSNFLILRCLGEGTDESRF